MTAIERICKERLAKAEGQDRLDLLDDLAAVLARMERFNDALTAIDEAIKIVSDNKNKLLLQFARISILMQKTDYKQAEAECQAMLKAALLPSEMMDDSLSLSSVYRPPSKWTRRRKSCNGCCVSTRATPRPTTIWATCGPTRTRT